MQKIIDCQMKCAINHAAIGGMGGGTHVTLLGKSKLITLAEPLYNRDPRTRIGNLSIEADSQKPDRQYPEGSY